MSNVYLMILLSLEVVNEDKSDFDVITNEEIPIEIQKGCYFQLIRDNKFIV